MESHEFSRIRKYLGKTQNQLARLLCVSPKAVQSFEQGWRKVPVSAERQLLIILSLEKASNGGDRPCWEVTDCPAGWRENCVVWEYKIKQFCWLINGTFCQGALQSNWNDKMELCRQCEVFQAAIPAITKHGSTLPAEKPARRRKDSSPKRMAQGGDH